MDLVFLLEKVLLPVLTGIGGIFIGVLRERRRYTKFSNSYDLKRLFDSLPDFRALENAFNEKSLKDSFKSAIYHEVFETFSLAAEDPSKMPMDREISERIIELRDLLRELTSRIGRDTFSVNGGYQSIRRTKWQFNEDDWETGDWLNDKATEIFKKYTELVKLAKSKGFNLEAIKET